MTGFGTGRSRAGDEEISVEVRAVNHKHLEVKVRLPRELAALEAAVVKAVRAACVRGAVDVAARRSASTASGAVPVVDAAMARGWREALATVARVAELADTPTAAQIFESAGRGADGGAGHGPRRRRGRAGSSALRRAGRAGGDAGARGQGARGRPVGAAAARGHAGLGGRGARAEDGRDVPGAPSRKGGGAPPGVAGGRGAAGAGGGALRRAHRRRRGGDPAPVPPGGSSAASSPAASPPVGGWTSSCRRCTAR